MTGLSKWASISAWRRWMYNDKRRNKDGKGGTCATVHPERVMCFDIVVAADRTNGIGNTNRIPWHIPSELRHFKRLTSTGNNAVIMGRRTWESLPKKAKPLPHRINIVVSRSLNSKNAGSHDVKFVDGLDEALQHLQTRDLERRIDTVFVIGGSELYAAALEHPQCRHIYMSSIDANYKCDKFFPEIDPARFELLSESTEVQNDNEPIYKFLHYTNRRVQKKIVATE